MLAIYHRWCAWTTVLPSFFYQLKFKCRFKNPLLSTTHMFVKSDGVPCPSMHVSSFLNSLFWIIEIRASVSLLPLPSWIDCGDCIVLWFLHVFVIVLLELFFCALLSTHHSTPPTKWPSLTYICQWCMFRVYNPLVAVPRFSFFGTSFLFPPLYVHGFLIHYSMCVRHGWALCQWPGNPYCFPHRCERICICFFLSL